MLDMTPTKKARAKKPKLGRPRSGEPWREKTVRARMNDAEHAAFAAKVKKTGKGKSEGTVARDVLLAWAGYEAPKLKVSS